MSWQSQQHSPNLVNRQCKIRKRGGSSSSSSSLVRRYRLKRAIMVGKRGGSTTPVPTWKTVRSPCAMMIMTNGEDDAELAKQQRPASKDGGGGGKGKEVPLSVSARKLAATLWEINEEAAPSKKKDSKAIKAMRIREDIAQLPSSAGSLPPKLSDPSYTPVSERKNGSGDGGHQRRLSAACHKLDLSDYHLGGSETQRSTSLTEVKDQAREKSDRKGGNGLKACLKEVSNGLSTSKELVKVVTRIWGVEEQHSLGTTLLSALRFELDRARAQIHQMIREQRSSCNEIEHLMKHFEEEKAAWKSKEREKIRSAIACVAEELEVEKKLRRQTERLNKKLGKELADKEAALSKVTKELEREKRAKEIFEQVCDELATGLGEDRAQVEELKRESEKVREEMEKEREMLQLADVLREERVQMKLSEAKYHFEEKNAAVEQLRNELEAHLRSKVNEGSRDSPDFKRIKELEAYLKQINFGSFQDGKKGENGMQVSIYREECDEEEDSGGDSDLHSIELEMDNNNRSYKWTYAAGDDTEDDSKRTSVDKQFRGRKSLSEKIQWESICLNKNSNGIDWEVGLKSQENSGGHHKEVSELVSQVEVPEHEAENKKNGSAKNLSEHRLSNSKVVPIRSFPSENPSV